MRGIRRPAGLAVVTILTLSLAVVALVGPVTVQAVPDRPEAAPPIFKEFPVPTPGAGPYGIAVGGDGAIWFAESTANKIGRLDPGGTIMERSLAVPNSAPHDLTLGRDGSLFVTLYNGDAIAQVTPSGRIKYFPIPSAFAQAQGIATAPDGTIWFAESSENNQIGVLTPNPGFIEEIQLGPVLLRPNDVAAGPDGAMWFTAEAGDVIGRITVQDHTITLFPVSAGALPWNITAGPDGAMWFTELAGRNIGRISMDGEVTEYPIPVGFGGAIGIATGFDGNIYFTQSDASLIGYITTSGQFGPSLPTGRSSWPTDMTAGPDGNIWFTERGSNVITRGTIARGNRGSVISADAGFIPKTETIEVGGTVRWWFEGPNQHTVTDVSGLFDTGPVDVGGIRGYRYTAAGSFPYVDSLHPVLNGTVEVSPSITSASRGQVGVVWASAGGRWTFDVQVKLPGAAAWSWWRRGATEPGGRFPAMAGSGTYEFRAKSRNASAGSRSGWSPVVAAEVSSSDMGSAGDGRAFWRSHGYLVPHPEEYQRLKAEATLRAGHLPIEAAPPAAGPILGASFAGQDEPEITPPDPTGSIGPNSYLQMINNRIAIYDRAGGVVAEAPIEHLVGGNHFNYSDPQVLWDPHTRRFYYLTWDTTSATFRWGFSKDADPRTLDGTSFCTYISGFGYNPTAIPDYPKLGQTTDFLLIGVNHFTGSIEYKGGDVLWIAKPQGSGVITTCPREPDHGRFSGLKDEAGVFANAPNPAQQVDPSGVGFVVSIPFTLDGNGSSITVFAVTKIAQTGKPRLGRPHSIQVPPYSYPAYAPECGDFGFLLDTLDGRLEHSVSAIDPRTGKTEVWTAHSVFGGAGAEVRWYEITPDPVSPTIFQAGRARSATLFAFNGAISPDRTVSPAGSAHGSSMVMGFSTTSASECPAGQMVSKVGPNPQSPFVVVRAPGVPLLDFSCVPICRWGDYGGATPDPTAPLGSRIGSVWLTNEVPVDHGGRQTGSQGSWIWEARP